MEEAGVRANRCVLRWLTLGPTPGQPSEARAPIEDSAYQKGAVWCLAMSNARENALAIAEFGIACLRKIRMLGAVSQKMGFACVQELGSMECAEAISQLTRMRAKAKYSVARRLIEKSLQQAAERSGLTVQELEDISVDSYGLDADGTAEIVIGDAKATVCEDGRVAVVWHNADGKVVKSPPSHIKKGISEGKYVRLRRSRRNSNKCISQADPVGIIVPAAQRHAGEPLAEIFLEHSLLGFLGRNLIWVFSDNRGMEESGIWCNNEVVNASGDPVDLANYTFRNRSHVMKRITQSRDWRLGRHRRIGALPMSLVVEGRGQERLDELFIAKRYHRID